MTTKESGCGKYELLERIAQFAPKDVFYVDELLVAFGGGEDIRSRQQLNSLFATNMDGSIKLPLMVFGDSIQQNNLHEMGQLPVVCLKQKTTISTQEALRQWLHMLDHMFSRIAKKVLMIIREAAIAGSVISQTKYSSLALLILPAKEQMIEKQLRQGITGTLNACYDHIVKQQQQSVALELTLKESVFTLYRCWKENLKASTIWNSFMEAGLIDSIKCPSEIFESTAPLDTDSRSDCSYSDCGSSSSTYDIWNQGDEDIEVLDTASEDDLQRFSDAEIEPRSTHTVIEDHCSIQHALDLPSEPGTEVILQSSKIEETANIQANLDIVYRRLLQLKGVSASMFEKFFKLEHYLKQRASGNC
ncbi:tigger transposable element-derived protein 4-like isoform X2 [Anopheles darlingi]|nr:tigger transposable element-derived protein 4-like isoform X2 [Anopheles darlingi]